MARVLFVNPSHWGRGITPIWIASHTPVLKARGHQVALFDATFFRDWAQNENAFNTANQQYQPSAYESHIHFDERQTRAALQAKIGAYDPDVIFWAAISSHINGEGEYREVCGKIRLYRCRICRVINHVTVHVSLFLDIGDKEIALCVNIR